PCPGRDGKPTAPGGAGARRDRGCGPGERTCPTDPTAPTAHGGCQMRRVRPVGSVLPFVAGLGSGGRGGGRDRRGEWDLPSSVPGPPVARTSMTAQLRPVRPAAEAPSTEQARPARWRLGYSPGLDGLRAVGMTVMLAYHGELAWGRGAYLALSQFFTLSGF